jgi:23S rRNA G2445 N2-methylase RlmL
VASRARRGAAGERLACFDFRQRRRSGGARDRRKNLAAAGFGERVKLTRADVLERTAPCAAGVLVANPPYGERTGSDDALARFYPRSAMR